MCKISVVMSCYNSEKYLQKSIDSILSQTFKDFEFIIWNDGSTDGTEEIVKSYKDRRIRYFYHDNTGLGLALRMACEQAKAPLIARMDADDISMKERLAVEYDYMARHPEVVLLSSAVEYIDENDILLGRSFPYMNDLSLRNIMYRVGGSAIVHPACMFRADKYRKAGGYIGLKKAQDSLLFARLAKYGKVKNITRVLLRYRLTPGSISHQTLGNRYAPIISAYLNKMIHDDSVSNIDVDTYNEIVRLSKKEPKREGVKTLYDIYEKTILERLFHVVRFVAGLHCSETFICYLKSVYNIIKFRSL